MHVAKKIAIVFISLILFLVLLNIAVSYWVTSKIPDLLRSKEGSSYIIDYDDVDVSLLTGSITMYKAVIKPEKENEPEEQKKDIYGTIDKLSVTHFNLWEFLFDDTVEVEDIIIDTPKFLLHQKDSKEKKNKKTLESLKKKITSDRVIIRNGYFSMLDSLEREKTYVANLDFAINNTTLDSTSADENIPVRYGSYNFSCDSIRYRINDFYTFNANDIVTTNNSFIANSIKVTPIQNRTEFNRLIPKERDQFTVAIDSVAIPKADWGFTNDTLFVHVPKTTLHTVNANIYRGKMVKDDPSTKKLYSQLLRELDFDLKIDTLMVKNSKITYEEQKSYDRQPGKISFSNFYASIYNIHSTVGKKDIPDTKIEVKCNFMNSAPLQVSWSFNSTNTSDAFVINGTLQNLKVKETNPVLKPLMNITAEGTIDEIQFVMNGNQNTAGGTFAIKYNDLKIEVLGNEGDSKKGFMSFVGNLAVINNSNGTMKQTEVTAQRVPNRSVFNFLFRFIRQGLKNTVLPNLISGMVGND